MATVPIEYLVIAFPDENISDEIAGADVAGQGDRVPAGVDRHGSPRRSARPRGGSAASSPGDAPRRGGCLQILGVAGHGAVQRHVPVDVLHRDIRVVDERVVAELASTASWMSLVWVICLCPPGSGQVSFLIRQSNRPGRN
jgi:hypothetical protein